MQVPYTGACCNSCLRDKFFCFAQKDIDLKYAAVVDWWFWSIKIVLMFRHGYVENKDKCSTFLRLFLFGCHYVHISNLYTTWYKLQIFTSMLKVGFLPLSRLLIIFRVMVVCNLWLLFHKFQKAKLLGTKHHTIIQFLPEFVHFKWYIRIYFRVYYSN